MNKINELKTKKFKNLIELENELTKIWNLPKASECDKNNWKYKTSLYISPKALIDKEVLYNNELYTITDIELNKYGKLIILLNDKTIASPTTCFLKIYNPIIDSFSFIQLHPGRKGKILWSKGYYLEEKIYKELYYSTAEYRNKYENTLNNNNKTFGNHAPIQIEKIKTKITNTIKNRYGVPWFLNRGDHYKMIEKVMIDKYGVANIFNDIEWQAINASKNYKKSLKGTSKIEKSFCKKIIETLSPINYYIEDSTEGRKIFYIENKYFIVDCYIPEKNLIIEFYGDYWHCNPNIYFRDYYHLYKHKTANEIWELDRIRLQKIINVYNCNVLIIWENDWRKNQSEELKKILSFYNSISI